LTHYTTPVDLTDATQNANKGELSNAAVGATAVAADFGMLEGTLTRIAVDAVGAQTKKDPQDSDANDPGISPYKALVKLKSQKLIALNGQWPLMPGIQIVADIRQGERTVMEYLLSPVKKVADEAGKER
jgi:HlyD family secretion protein